MACALGFHIHQLPTLKRAIELVQSNKINELHDFSKFVKTQLPETPALNEELNSDRWWEDVQWANWNLTVCFTKLLSNDKLLT